MPEFVCCLVMYVSFFCCGLVCASLFTQHRVGFESMGGGKQIGWMAPHTNIHTPALSSPPLSYLGPHGDGQHPVQCLEEQQLQRDPNRLFGWCVGEWAVSVE